MKFWIMKKLVWLVLRCRLYFFWSKIYRFLFERKYNDIVLPKLHSIDTLSLLLGNMVWTKDKWWMLGDAISTAKAVYWRHLKGDPVGDCDDFAMFAMDRIKDMINRDIDTPIFNSHFLTCTWMDKNNKVKGHNVCVFYYKNKLMISPRCGYIGNWFQGNPHDNFKGVKEIVQDILMRKKGRLLGWSITDKNLKLIRYESKI